MPKNFSFTVSHFSGEVEEPMDSFKFTFILIRLSN